jgi:hypothetical protein
LKPLGLRNGLTTIGDNLDHLLKRGVMQVQIPVKETDLVSVKTTPPLPAKRAKTKRPNPSPTNL